MNRKVGSWRLAVGSYQQRTTNNKQRMFFTARQLQALHKTHGRVVLPYRAKLTPLAKDWIKSSGIVVGYSDVEASKDSNNVPATHAETARYFWWSDGPCGPAKAAMTMLERESPIAPLPTSPVPMPGSGQSPVAAIRQLAGLVKSQQTAGGVLLVKSAASAMVYANRCPSLRAIVGTCRGSVEEGIRAVAANVLVIEHPRQTMMQVKNLTAQFVKARRETDEQTRRDLAELASCG